MKRLGGAGARMTTFFAELRRRRVFRVPEMESALERDFAPDALAGLGVDPAGLLADLEASAEYRSQLVSVMARKAVTACSG